uniref:F-box/LRR-repeat protein 15 n=1 Tax=Phallusia mammillata TaxID=59560 RepID=A0A6F9DC29_9ASCI|nr:F-box/LRR-repeat protein 15 [Phallusia mammillata]
MYSYDFLVETRFWDACAMDMVSSLPLHDVVFPKIFKYLSIEELFTLRMVSKTYCHTIKEYFKQCLKLDLSQVVNKTKFTSDAFKILTDENEVLQDLNLTDANHWLTDDLLVPVVCSCPQLNKIDVTNCTQLSNRSLCMMGTYCNQLTHVTLQGCHWVDKDNYLVLVSNNPNLLFLNVSSCWSLDDECMCITANKCNKLQTVSVSKCYSVSDQTIERLASFCSELQKLDISGCWRVSDNGIRICVYWVVEEYCNKLKELCVKDCQNVTERSLKRLRDLKIKVDIAPWSQEIVRNVQFGVFQLGSINLQI